MVGWMVWLAVAQTSPLVYVGIDQVGRYFTTSGTAWDSTFFPTQVFDTYTIKDSMLAVQDTTMGGLPGKILFSFNFQADTLAGVDTLLVWEDGGAVMAFYPVGDSIYPIVYYMTPLADGMVWSMGFPYATPGQFVGDSTSDIDTMYVENDTVRVVGVQNITVPLGNFDTYHLIRTLDFVIVGTNPGAFDPESITVAIEIHEWVAPNVGPVKDSSYMEVNVKIFGSWVLAQKKISSSEAYDRGLPVAEGVAPRVDRRPVLVVNGARFALRGVERGSRVELADALGRVLARGVVRGEVYEGTLPEGKGLYWIRVRRPDGQVVTLKAVRLR